MKEKGDKMRDHFLCFNNFSQSTRDQACHWYANNHRVIATGKAFISCWGTKGKKEKREIIQVEWEILAHVFTADEKNDNEFFLFLLSPVVFTTLLYSSFSLSLTFFLFIIYTWRRRQESERRNARYTSFCLQLRSLHERPKKWWQTKLHGNQGKDDWSRAKERRTLSLCFVLNSICIVSFSRKRRMRECISIKSNNRCYYNFYTMHEYQVPRQLNRKRCHKLRLRQCNSNRETGRVSIIVGETNDWTTRWSKRETKNSAVSFIHVSWFTCEILIWLLTKQLPWLLLDYFLLYWSQKS